MQPNYPFLSSDPESKGLGIKARFETGLKWLSVNITKPFVWLPASASFLVVLGAGAYFLTAGLQPTQPPSNSVATKPNAKAEQQNTPEAAKIEEVKKQEEAKKKEAAKKSPTATPAPTTSGGGTTTSPPASSPAPPAPPAAPAPTVPSGGYVKPNSGNTGPRYSTTRTLTPDQALAELRNTGYLSRVVITGRLQLSGSDGRNWLIEDSVIHASSSYGLQTYSSLSSFTGTYSERPIFRYVEVIGRAALGTGGCSAVVYGSNVVLEHADLYGCDDAVKASSNVSIISSWLHDNDHPSGAHCDSLQIRSGTNILVIGSRFDSYVAYSSDGSQVPSGDTCSGGLQTGSVTGTISARYENNWFAGGHYTIRGWADRDAGYSMSYIFRNNKWMRNGTSVALGLTNLPPNRYGPVYGSLDDFDATNVWEDTGLPVRN